LAADRLDLVQIPLSRGTVELTSDSRDRLIGEMSLLPSADSAILAFNGPGARAPIQLTRSDKALLVDVIDMWSLSVPVQDLPAGVWMLRNGLLHDLRDHGAGDP
jgi:hypothetical protein